MKFRLKPIEVEAMEMTASVEIGVGGHGSKPCQVGDFLVRNPDGSIRLVGHDAFFTAYEPCDPGAMPVEDKPKRRHRRKANMLSLEEIVALRAVVPAVMGGVLTDEETHHGK